MYLAMYNHSMEENEVLKLNLADIHQLNNELIVENIYIVSNKILAKYVHLEQFDAFVDMFVIMQ